MNKVLKYACFLSAVIMFTACEKDDPAVVVDAALQPYFDRFVDEGALRGVTVDFSAIEVEAMLSDIDGNNINGQCISNSARANTLLVDNAFWNGASDIEKEFVIFHELGHCYLDRSHLDTENSDGTCASMMHSGTSGCTNAYNQMTRSFYLDELFQ